MLLLLIWPQCDHIKRHLLYNNQIKFKADCNPNFISLLSFASGISDFFRNCEMTIFLLRNHQGSADDADLLEHKSFLFFFFLLTRSIFSG